MANPVLNHVPQKQAKKLIQTEAARRRTGNWGDWETMPGPFSEQRGWLSQCTRAHVNRVFSVLERNVGDVVHLAVSSLSERRPTWPEMQRIKDEIAGPDATAVEVYPLHDEIVDEANMYHIWVLPEHLGFGLPTGRPKA